MRGEELQLGMRGREELADTLLIGFCRKIMLSTSTTEQGVVISRTPKEMRSWGLSHNSDSLLKKVMFQRKPVRAYSDMVTSGIY